MKPLSLSNPFFATFLVVVLAGGATACSGDTEGVPPEQPTPGNAFLTIIGDRNVFLESGQQVTIQVKYHDAAGRPLAGAVEFHVEGDANGANVATGEDVVNAQGIAEVAISAPGPDEASFRVVASAEFATSVDWRVAVSAGDPPLPPIGLTGLYDVDSQFDMVSGLPGTVGDVVGTFIDMTDSPNDPATFIIDLALDAIDSDSIKDAVGAVRPGLDGFLNEILLDVAPEFVGNLVDIGDAFGQAAKKLGTISEIKVYPIEGTDGQELRGTHQLTGFKFVIDGTEHEYTLEEMGISVPPAKDFTIALVGSKMMIGEHALPVSYGTLLLFALNNIIIPSIDPFSSDLEDLLNYFVDCYSISFDLADYVGIGSPGIYEAACETGLAAVAAYVEDEIKELDGTAAALNIHGECKPQDLDGDNKADKLNAGLWEGTMSFGIATSTLAKPDQKFIGIKRTTID